MKLKTFLRSSHREYRRFLGGVGGVGVDLPVIVTDQGVLEDFARYMHLNRFMSRSWQDAATFSVQLLLEYLDAHQNSFASPKSLFVAFSNALFTGTVENYCDPSQLWWLPRPPQEANALIGHITRFTDWMSLATENDQVQLNPWRQATTHEQRLNWAAYSHRRDNAFLSHLWRPNDQTQKSRTVRFETLPTERTVPHKTFPDEQFDLLLRDGLRRRTRDMRGSQDLRNTLITYLMHYGGLRLSEALSLWSEDVTIEAGEVIVRVHHPEYGSAPDGSMRSVFLQRRYGLAPRNTLVKAADPLFLGWKDCLITDPDRCCFEVFFYPHETAYEFAELWRDYHQIQRAKPKTGETHPYAFTNRDGQPYTHRMLRKAHRLGIERIGLAYGKSQGTTPHGHRHAYGQRLARDGAHSLLIKFAMHHKSIESAKVYTQPTSAQMRKELRDMEARLFRKHSGNALLEQGKVDSD